MAPNRRGPPRSVAHRRGTVFAIFPSTVKQPILRQLMTDYDSPWKEALSLYFQPFLAFFFPEAHAEIDWSRGYQSLDQ